MTMAPASRRNPVVVGIEVQSSDFPALANIPCKLCGGKMESTTINYERDFAYVEVWIRVVLIDYPVSRCSECGVEVSLVRVNKLYEPILGDICKVALEDGDITSLQLDPAVAVWKDPRPETTQDGKEDPLALNCDQCGGAAFLELVEVKGKAPCGPIIIKTEGYKCHYHENTLFSEAQQERFDQRWEAEIKRVEGISG